MTAQRESKYPTCEQCGKTGPEVDLVDHIEGDRIMASAYLCETCDGGGVPVWEGPDLDKEESW